MRDGKDLEPDTSERRTRAWMFWAPWEACKQLEFVVDGKVEEVCRSSQTERTQTGPELWRYMRGFGLCNPPLVV